MTKARLAVRFALPIVVLGLLMAVSGCGKKEDAPVDRTKITDAQRKDKQGGD